MPYQLPNLPEPFVDDYYWLSEDGDHEEPLWNAEQMRAYALEAVFLALRAEYQREQIASAQSESAFKANQEAYR